MQHINIHIPGSSTAPSRDYDQFIGKIIPKFIIENGIPKYMTKLHNSYHLEGFEIKRLEGRLASVRIFGKHPNVDNINDELCLKDEEIGSFISNIEALKNILVNRLEVYYFDESHFRPSLGDYEANPVEGFTKIDVNFEKGEIYHAEGSAKRIY